MAQTGVTTPRSRTPMQYLDSAASALRSIGLMPDKVEPAPINALLQKISDLDEDKIALISRTLGQAEVFNEVVRRETAQMEIGQRYQQITSGFDSIRGVPREGGDPVACAQAGHLDARASFPRIFPQGRNS